MKKKFYLHQAQWDWFEKCGVDMSNCILTQPIPQMPKEKSMAIINKNCTYVLYQLDWDAFNVLAPFQDEEKLFEYVKQIPPVEREDLNIKKFITDEVRPSPLADVTAEEYLQIKREGRDL